MRINKYMADKGLCSRREADKLIRAGRVKIDGRRAELGDQVEEGAKVEVVGRGAGEKLVYIAYNKPTGIVTHSPRDNEEGITDVIDVEEKVFPVGRLDKASSGLIILTNDGRVTGRLLSPTQSHQKEYTVKTAEPLKDGAIRKLGRGVRIEGYMTKSARVSRKGPNSFSIILTEGKRHQIRRMCAALGLTVTDLRRTRIGNIKIGKLNPGEYRYLQDKELEKFLEDINLNI